YLWNRDHGVGENNLLDELPYVVRQEVQMLLFRSIANRVKFFSECDERVIHDLFQQMKSEVYTPEECIVRHGQMRPDMWFILKGKVQVLNEKQEIIDTLRSGGSYGD